MKKTSPFLPGISSKLSGRQRRRQLEEFRIRRQELRARSLADYATLFSSILPMESMEEISAHKRSRLFPESVTFWAWVSQLIEGNASCAKAITLVQSWYCSAGLPSPSVTTSSFCRGRQRLSKDFLDGADALIKTYSDARLESSHRWYGHRLKAIDGTTFKLLDTPENQAVYPQPSGQAPGCGFPVMGAVGVLDLATGRLEDFVTHRDRTHDAVGMYRLMDCFASGDVVIADRAFCSYESMAMLLQRDAHSVMRLHQMRHRALDWRQGRKIDHDSRLVIWKKPPRPGKSGISRAEWEALPDSMEVRLVRVKGTGRDGKPRTMILATTLLEECAYPTEEIALLYAERWKIEVKFRDIKSTMNLDILRVKSPDMAHKTLRMIQICYNLIKALQLEAIRGEDVILDEIGFKGTLDVIVEFRSRFRHLQNRPRLLARRLREVEERIVERLLLIRPNRPNRPNRSEPRAMKRRPKLYQLMTRPRAEFAEIKHRSRYRAAA